MDSEVKKSSNLASVLWLIFFFPVGLYFMWAKTNWNKKVKWIISGIYGFFILISIIGSSNSPKTQVASNTKVASNAVVTQPTSVPKPTQPPQPTVAPKATNTPTPSPTPIPKDANGFPMDYTSITVAQIAKVPSAYNNKTIMFTCTVSGFVKDDSGDAAGFNCSDPDDYSSILQVDSGKLFDYTKINADDTVRIYGLGQAASSGQNAFGGNVTEAVVLGVDINDLTSGYTKSTTQ